MKKIISFALSILLLVSLSSCDGYVSSYKALGLIKSQTTHSFSAQFYSLDGQLVFKVKKSGEGEEGSIHISAEVEEGEIYVYYDIYGVKEELAHLSAGESVDENRGYVESGNKVYIIIETVGSARGKVSCELDN
jgi:hypothetical protein